MSGSWTLSGFEKSAFGFVCSIVELAEQGCGPTDPVGRSRVELGALAGNLNADDVVGGLTSGAENTTSQARLVHGARVLVLLGDVVLGGLEVDQRHAIIQDVLRKEKGKVSQEGKEERKEYLQGVDHR